MKTEYNCVIFFVNITQTQNNLNFISGEDLISVSFLKFTAFVSNLNLVLIYFCLLFQSNCNQNRNYGKKWFELKTLLKVQMFSVNQKKRNVGNSRIGLLYER